MSTSTFRWQVLLIANVLIGIGGLVLIVLIALGIADPPRAGSLHWQANSIAAWPTHQEGEVTTYTAPVGLDPPFTLVLTANNSGPANSGWGIKFFNVEAPIEFLISNEGYYTFSPRYAPWQEFLHIEPYETNSLSLHVINEGHGTIHINDEIVTDRMAFFYLPVEWGIVTYNGSQLTWEKIALYHE